MKMAKKNTSGVDADNILTSELLPKIIETLDEYKNLDFLAIQLQNVTEEGRYLDVEFG